MPIYCKQETRPEKKPIRTKQPSLFHTKLFTTSASLLLLLVVVVVRDDKFASGSGSGSRSSTAAAIGTGPVPIRWPVSGLHWVVLLHQNLCCRFHPVPFRRHRTADGLLRLFVLFFLEEDLGYYDIAGTERLAAGFLHFGLRLRRWRSRAMLLMAGCFIGTADWVSSSDG